MGENNNTGSSPEPSSRRDGGIDFSRYTTQQLQELQGNLDAAASPLIHAALSAELERRTTAAPQATRWTGRFTRRPGLAGWLFAKLRRSPLYGEGAVEVQPGHLVLHGRQRTWLGVGIERALQVPLDRVRNAIATAAGLRFEVRRRFWLPSKVEFLPDNAVDREDMVRALPDARTDRFRRYGASLLEFEEQLRSRCRIAWLTPVLVMANVAVFIAMWAQAGSLVGAINTPFALLGANIGPLTLEGQWWRLLSAIFIHANALHLLLNVWVLWNIGSLSERLYGRGLFLVLYIAGGLFAGLSSLLWDPARGSVGASGAIFALFGAFLAYLLHHRRTVPRGIFRSHWIPTLLFVGISLYNGAMTPGVDNAAHVGGLLCGFAFGLLLTRSTDASAGAALRLHRATALVLYLLCAGGTLSFVLWTRGPTPVGQQFAASHAWYISGEARNTAVWQQLAGAAAAGVVADEDLGRRVARDILPFWKEAVPRLESEIPVLHGESQRYVQGVAKFARLRKEWAEAVVASTSGRDGKMLEVAREKDAEAMAEVARIERLGARSTAARLTGGLVNLSLVQGLRSRLSSGQRSCVGAPPAHQVGIPVDDADLATDTPRVVKRIACEAQELFLDADFKELDARFADAASRTGDLPAGSSTLSALYGGLSDLIYYSEGVDIAQYLRQLAMWRRTVPDSFYPDLLEVELYHLWAWSARGHGTATQITPQAWALFSHRNEMAQASLDESAAAAQHDPLWCHLTMRLQHDRTNDLKRMEETFFSCSSRFPKYTHLYRNMLRALMPRWYGKAGQVAEFIEKTADSLPEEQRDAMYAQLFWIYADLESDDVNIFHDSSADWTRLHHGFGDLRKKYPESDLVLNAHARFACLAEDAEIYRSLERRMYGRRSASAWTRKTMRQDCDERM